jgi:GTP cyclohydrolase II
MTASYGVILYLRQEGRGIGLYNKLEAYHLQELGLDTFSANRALAFRDDMRDYRTAAQMLKALGLHRVRLLTNNPDKARQLVLHGVQVEKLIGTAVHVTSHNKDYMLAKRDNAGHLLNLSSLADGASARGDA